MSPWLQLGYKDNKAAMRRSRELKDNPEPLIWEEEEERLRSTRPHAAQSGDGGLLGERDDENQHLYFWPFDTMQQMSKKRDRHCEKKLHTLPDKSHKFYIKHVVGGIQIGRSSIN